MVSRSHTRIHRSLGWMILAAATLIPTVACAMTGFDPDNETIRGSGTIASEERAVSGFSRIHLIGGGELRIEQGDTEGLTIEAEDNLLEYLTSEVDGDTLVLSAEEGYNYLPSESIIYHISLQSLESIEVEGGATIVAEDLSLDTLDINISGGATVTLSGTVNRQSITVSGGGTYNGEDMASQETIISISGAGTMTVRVEDQLDVTISGAGTVTYIGDPQVTESISGAGVVRKQ